MNPFRSFVSDYARLIREARTLSLGNLPAPRRTAVSAHAPVALIFAPHPDDECIVGAWPLRLQREAGLRVVNVAVTLGSNRERRAGRWEELQAACGWLGFGLELPAPGGLENINPQARQAAPGVWQDAVKVVAGVLERYRPSTLFFPHELDANSTHRGTYYLVREALQAMPVEFTCQVVETEFWGAHPQPNIMVESSVDDVADLIAALSLHVGEVRRNPYHVGLPAWLQDNVRRGAELVGGQGGAAPDYAFATLYRLSRWARGGLQEAKGGKRWIGVGDNSGERLA
jgi:N-acetylglucosamine malate deacetylase 1